MNPFQDDLPDVPPCPQCDNRGAGLEWAFDLSLPVTSAQCACLKCGAHGVPALTYAQAVENFKAGKLEDAA